MHINIQIAAEKTITLKVNPSITVYELKTLIEVLEGKEREQQQLQLDGKILMDFFTLVEAGFSDGCKIVLSKKNKVLPTGENVSFAVSDSQSESQW